MGSVVDDANKETSKIVVSQNEEKEVFKEKTTVENDPVEKKDEDVPRDENEEKEIGFEEKIIMESDPVIKKDEDVFGDENDQIESEKKYTVVFVLGGPGGGKTTQSANISKEIGFTHLSSGHLLRKASKCDLEHGPMIERMIKEGESVPPELTMKILIKAMDQSGNDKFLLDGFPRDDEIRAAFEAATKTEPVLVLFFDCSEEEREKRILNRNQGRVDDNPESVRKRFKYFQDHTLPVVKYYGSKGKVYKIDAGKPMEEVFQEVKEILSSQAFGLSDAQAEAAKDGGEPEAEALEREILKIKL